MEVPSSRIELFLQLLIVGASVLFALFVAQKVQSLPVFRRPAPQRIEIKAPSRLAVSAPCFWGRAVQHQ